MPGQEKMVMDFYKKNPNALASLRGTVYEEKILTAIKQKGKANKKEISKDEAEKILKESQNQTDTNDEQNVKTKKNIETKKTNLKKTASKPSKSKTLKKKSKVSK